MDSSGKIILVTGASSGMGKATALKLIGEGHTVYGAARRVEKMQDLEAAGGRAMKLDVTDHAACVDVVEEIVRENGRIDVLVNNAGYAVYGAIEDTSIEDARRQFEVNLFGVAALTRAVLPHMRQQRSGRIVNVTSMGGKIYTPLGAWYHATKHALEGWSDCLRLETAAFGIDVVIIEPGIIGTEFGDVMTQPMLDRSAGGAYEDLARRVAKSSREAYEGGEYSPPSVIAELIARAIAAKKPKTRYSGGRAAKLLMWLRKYAGDRAFDRGVMSQIAGGD